jgi:MraZ protein
MSTKDQTTAQSSATTSSKRVYRHEPTAVDDKGRIRLHEEFLNATGTNVVLVHQVTGVIRMYPQAEFDRLEEKLFNDFSEGNDAADYYRQVFLSNARRGIKTDSAQRISIPADFRVLAGIDTPGKCVIVANGNQFQIMSAESYAAFQKSPLNFKASERDELDRLKEKAFQEERQLQGLRSNSNGDSI